MNLDRSRKYLKEDECFFLLNNERYLDEEGNKKGTLGETGPLTANRIACEMEFPKGDNYIVGKYYSKLTNELYYWNWNSNKVHFISRINGNGICEVVYYGDCLQLSASPKHSIEQFRAYMQVDKICANRHGKSLIWTDGKNPIGQIDVEASIATDFFTTPFFERCDEGCTEIQMCVPDPCGCVMGEFIPLTEDDRGKKNNLVDVGIQMSYRHVYYDGRSSIWADPSTMFYQNTKGCFDNTDGYPRCLKIRVPIGNPLVETIEIAYIVDGIWYKADIVEKYKKYNSTQDFWYERGLAELTNYSEEDCSFDYIFCRDKQCEAIDPTETIRVYNPMPIKPQGILPIGIGEDRTALGFYNYEQGNCPIDKTVIDKIKIGVDCPTQNCVSEYTTIKVRLIIHNFIHSRNQFIFRMGGKATNDPDDLADTAYFGGVNDVGDAALELGYGQQFSGKTRNFIVYIEGTDTWAEMKQWKSQPFFTGREQWSTIAEMEDGTTKRRWRRAIRNGEFFYQEAELKVLKGTRGFIRVASHESTGNDQDKSTFVVGTQDLSVYRGNLTIGTGFTERIEEIYIDTCGKDEIDLRSQAFVVSDNAVDGGDSTKASAFHGYIKDISGRPLEGMVVKIAGVECVTDFNGFYHLYYFPGNNSSVAVNVYGESVCNANFTILKTGGTTAEAGANVRFDMEVDNATYQIDAYANVKLLVHDCNGSGVSGVRVALSGSKYDVTDANGYARFRIRNYESRNRIIRYVVVNNSGCFASDCNGLCNPCMPTEASFTANCYVGIPVVNFPSARIKINQQSVFSRGLKAGGRYPFGVVAKGDCGMQSAVYETNYVDIKKYQERGSLGFCTLNYTASGTVWPSWVKCVDIVRGVNVNPFELQWVVDKVERIDGKVKLTIQSLNDYNEKYFFKSNTVYQWLKGDRIEFIKNGDGKLFDAATYGILNYLTISPFHDEVVSGQTTAEANYFNQLLIDDDGKLDGLTKGAVIEMQRLKECTTLPTYFSICVSIPVVDGLMLYPTGVFETFDTYLVKRNIGTLPTEQFEHKYPSDFWGSNANGLAFSDVGRAYFVNKYENKRRYGRNITINAPNVFNYFGDLVKTIDPDSHGDIIAMWSVDNKVGLCISEHDNSLFQIGDDLLRVGNDGVVRAAGPDALISDSQSKISGSYGCQYMHIGSIYFGDGWATWVDVNNHTFIKHDYQLAKPADEGLVQSHFRKRCQELESSNRVTANPIDQFRFSTGYNNHTGALMLTIKAFSHGCIYNQIKPWLQPNDTIMFHPIAEDWLGFASFTQEAYGELNLFDGNGCAFISFCNGVPYIHPIVPEKWNEFNGTAVDRVVGFALNKYPTKMKKGKAIEIDSQTMWFVADVSTEITTFKSEIPPVKMERNMNKWNGGFLRDINSRGGLYKGKELEGLFHSITIVRDNTDAKKYGTIDNSKRIKFDALDEITTKFSIAEQNGLTENL